MKKNLMILAAAAAAFGLLAITGCDKNGCEAEPSAGTVSINKVWVADLTISEGEETVTMTYCLDMGAAHENTFILAMSGMDPTDPNVYVSYDEGYTIKSITPADETSGTIIVNFNTEDGSESEDETITYSNLTENSVTITTKLADPMSGTVSEITYDCTLAPEQIKVYTMTEYMEIMYPSEGGETTEE